MKKLFVAIFLCICMTLTVSVHAEEFHMQANSSRHGEIPMYMISGNAPVLDGTFSEEEWGDYLVTDMATPDTPYTYVEDSYNNLPHEEWLEKVFTPVRFYATYDETYVYVCAMTEDKDHACVSSWEGDYADIRIWKPDNYDGEKDYQFNNGITDVSTILKGTASAFDYAFGRDEDDCVTCYEFRAAWTDITNDGTPGEFRLRVALGFGISDYQAYEPMYPPFMGAATFGFADPSIEDDRKHNANTMIPLGVKQVAEQPADTPVETPAETPADTPVETPVEVPEQTPDTTAPAPATADMGLMSALLAAAFASAAIVYSKKR